ncbi:RNA polymerase sigma factor (sigma-70 family) [Actinoplanes octamycinicus]|uniref:RNA polymerase sigma factor (Sigma-70 family) n=1 Tax=Actinoplanes octamycinicus TaxID=135948 RepID=A0A7W7H3B9_9ACTN|nr:RNA polymerase sigma factor [Actinoplanes octamycinicus]MBB4743233.1 RNA polymerase sigma factor (sigma-70 family) [Actinoplanes octamycinicus]GIE61203.1 RNA polymerase subunit sigma-24 [Actinoplanes octamycinicus]
MATDTHRAIEAVWRIEAPRLIAGLTRLVRDVGVAEELAQDALVAALEQWPADGVPDNPGAWLMTTAKRRAIDQIRRTETYRRKVAEVGRDLAESTPDIGTLVAEDDGIGDDLLRLVFIACHPVLSTEARAALTLRLLGGLTTDEIARAFLVPEPTVAQRIVRAKKTLATAKVPFEVPQGAELAARLASVLEVIYLIFNEGYSATAGDDWMRPALCEDALRLGRILARLTPREPEVHGLVALMEFQASRAAARTGPDGEPILLADQNRARWDRLLIGRGLAALAKARDGGAPGPYALQAAIAACHARARRFEDTDWVRIAGLYEQLAAAAPSPVVELNRAVALSMAYGPAAGLALLDQLAAFPALRNYHLLPSTRGDLLAKLGRHAEARSELRRAAALTRNERERTLLLDRVAALEGRPEC